MIGVQKSFIGGLNFLTDDSQISDDGYFWVINARNRYGRLQPIKKHLEIDLPHHVTLQGGISVGNVLIVFLDGSAYYLIDGAPSFVKIPGFSMSFIAPTLWAVSVPGSTQNYFRKLTTDKEVNSGIKQTIDFKVNGIPSGIVVQDGVNQPWFIQFDSVNNIFVPRLCKTYAQWENTSSAVNNSVNREYVPIGRQMIVVNNTLFIVAPDGKTLYRSVTGRPLDFMINVDINGNKLTSENEGGARSMSQAFDFDEITYIGNCDIPNSFVWGTKRNTRIVTLDYTNLAAFDEPSFFESSKINVGIVNQFSFEQSLSDYVQIESGGVKSYNAVQQFKFKGNSSIFSSNIDRLIYDAHTKKRIKQIRPSVGSLDNWLFFSLDTFWGDCIAVYDVLLDRWVSLDFTPCVRVKQFILVDTENEDKLYALTYDGKLFLMFGDTNTAVPALKVKSFVVPETMGEHKGSWVRFMFKGGTEDGTCFFREFVDDKESEDNYQEVPLTTIKGGVKYPVRWPVVPSTETRTENPSFNCNAGLVGKKVSFIVKWDNDAELIEFTMLTSEQHDKASKLQQNQTLS